jgi:hypothetical protein
MPWITRPARWSTVFNQPRSVQSAGTDGLDALIVDAACGHR